MEFTLGAYYRKQITSRRGVATSWQVASLPPKPLLLHMISITPAIYSPPIYDIYALQLYTLQLHTGHILKGGLLPPNLLLLLYTNLLMFLKVFERLILSNSFIPPFLRFYHNPSVFFSGLPGFKRFSRESTLRSPKFSGKVHNLPNFRVL